MQPTPRSQTIRQTRPSRITMSSTAQDLSSTDLEEIFNLDPAVLEQLLQEEEPCGCRQPNHR